MKSNYKKSTLIVSLLWFTSLLGIGNFSYGQTVATIDTPVEILIAETELSGSSESHILFNLAKKYHDGNSVKQDFLRAHSLYLKAAGMGNNDARINLGYL